jgi:hypothetical protein
MVEGEVAISLPFEIMVQKEPNPNPQPAEFFVAKQTPNHQRSAWKEIGRAHNQAIGMKERKNGEVQQRSDTSEQTLCGGAVAT